VSDPDELRRRAAAMWSWDRELAEAVPTLLDQLAALRDERNALHQRVVELETSLHNTGAMVAIRLRKAIEKHRWNLWGGGSTEHPADIALYQVLAETTDQQRLQKGQ